MELAEVGYSFFQHLSQALNHDLAEILVLSEIDGKVYSVSITSDTMDINEVFNKINSDDEIQLN